MSAHRVAREAATPPRSPRLQSGEVHETLKCFEPVARWEPAFAGSKRLSLLGWECHVNTSRWTVYHPETGTTTTGSVAAIARANSLEENMTESERVLRSFGLQFHSELPT